MQFFEWDDEKAASNLTKHGVSFEEARSVFSDVYSLTIFDKSHSDNEDRFIDLGISSQERLLIVIYTERGSLIRIISSRLAEKMYQEQYEQFR